MPAGAKAKVTDVIVRQPDYLKADRRRHRGRPLATWKEYLTFGLISAYADDLSHAVRRLRVRVQRQGDRRTPGAAAALEARRRRSRAGARRAGRPALHRALLQARSEGAHGRAHPATCSRRSRSGSTSSSGCRRRPRCRRRPSSRSIRVKIAYPDQWRDFSALEVKPGDHVGNLLRSREFQTAESWSRARQAGRALALGHSRRRRSTRPTARPTTRSRSRPASCSRPSSISTPTMRSTTARSAR